MIPTKTNLSNHEGIVRVMGVFSIYPRNMSFGQPWALKDHIDNLLKNLHLYEVLESKTLELNLVVPGEKCSKNNKISANEWFRQCLITINGLWNHCSFYEAQRRIELGFQIIKNSEKADITDVSIYLNWIDVCTDDVSVQRHKDIHSVNFPLEE